MAWQIPKTDWTVTYDTEGNYTGDYFNTVDFQRIKGNLEYLAGLAEMLCVAPEPLNIPAVTTASFGLASSINALETSLDKLLACAFDPGIPARKTWVGNSVGPSAADMNRIEGSCQQLYDILTQQAAARRILSFTLGLEVI